MSRLCGILTSLHFFETFSSFITKIGSVLSALPYLRCWGAMRLQLEIHLCCAVFFPILDFDSKILLL